MEMRCPDPAANPYLTLAVCLAAGLDGIKNQIMPPEEVRSNIFDMTMEEKETLGIESLPLNLKEAIDELEQSEFVKGVLGTHITEKYVEAKRQEWQSYTSQVTNWEIDEYLYKI